MLSLNTPLVRPITPLMLTEPYPLSIADDALRIDPDIDDLADIFFRHGVVTGINTNRALCIDS